MSEKRSDDLTDNAALIAELLDRTLTTADTPNAPHVARLELLKTVSRVGDMDYHSLQFAERVLDTAEHRGSTASLRWLYEHRELLARLNRELSALELGAGLEMTAVAASRELSLSYDDVRVMCDLTLLRDLNPELESAREQTLRLFHQYRRLADVGVPRLAAYAELTPPRGRGVVSAATLAEWTELLDQGMPAELILTLRGFSDDDVEAVRDLLC